MSEWVNDRVEIARSICLRETGDDEGAEAALRDLRRVMDRGGSRAEAVSAMWRTIDAGRGAQTESIIAADQIVGVLCDEVGRD